MNKYVIILLAFLFINGAVLFWLLGTTIPGEKVFPIISWLNVVLILALLLPSRVASFLTI